MPDGHLESTLEKEVKNVAEGKEIGIKLKCSEVRNQDSELCYHSS